MTLKRRILIANTLMVGIPVAATLAALMVCALVLWHALSLGQGFDDSSDFREAALAVTAATDRALGAEGATRASRLDELDRLLDKVHLSLTVTDASGATVHAHGEDAGAGALASASASLSDGGMVEQDGRAVLVTELEAGGALYRLTASGAMNVQASYTRLKALVLACAVAVIACVLASSALAGRVAQRFLIRRIEDQLNDLKAGLRALANGDLAYRIDWAPDAEFALACDDFNLMAERQQRAVERLERQDSRRRQLVADISHDLRSPLTAVRGYAEALRDGVVRAPERQARYLGVICEKAEQMDALVEALFEYSKLEVDDYPVRAEPIRAVEELAGIAAAYERSRPGEIEISVEAAGEQSGTGEQSATGARADPLVLADRALLRRVAENLLDNSVKYRAGDRARVAVSVEAREGRCLLSFIDDGTGVEQDSLERIFDPFFRADAAREHPEQGSGLGLAFVRRAVELMGGSVRARANVPHGLAVELDLPLADEGAAGEDAGTTASTVAGASAGMGASTGTRKGR